MWQGQLRITHLACRIVNSSTIWFHLQPSLRGFWSWNFSIWDVFLPPDLISPGSVTQPRDRAAETIIWAFFFFSCGLFVEKSSNSKVSRSLKPRYQYTVRFNKQKPSAFWDSKPVGLWVGHYLIKLVFLYFWNSTQKWKEQWVRRHSQPHLLMTWRPYAKPLSLPRSYASIW